MSSKQIRFQQPALNFHEALPIGSGRLGAMVYSGISSDRLSLNADTLWAGLEPPKPRENANKAFLEARELLFADKRHEAEALLESQVETDFVQPYLPAGDLIITMQEAEGAGDYSRSLTLDDALARSEFLIGDIRVQKESFASFPDDVIVLKWRASEGCLPALRFALNSPLRHECVADGDGLKLHGRLPVNVRWDVVDYEATPENYVTYSDASVRYCVDCRIVAHDGELAAHEGALGLENARYFVAHISIARADEDRKFRKLKANLNRLKAQSYEDLKARHVADYCALFEQFSLRIGENKSPEDSGAWIESAGDLPAKLQRGFDFGRYLLIASSRLGTMPANLQGIWNEEITPPWWSNYTININTQMNYWGAEMTGLSECHLPLFEFIRKLAENGENTAREQYGARGWVVHHQTDYLGQTTPVGYLPYDVISDSAKWAIWVMGGPWLSLHIIEHARYHNDTGVLKKYYSVLEGAAAFLCDWLIEDRNNPGFLTTAPSTSPENTYIFSDGASCALTTGSTMDIAITRQYFREMLWVMERLGISDALKVEIEAKLSRLPDTPYTDDGRILEFDADWPEGEAPHRHISHLFALTPGNSVDPIIDETYAKGALKALAYRGDTGTGWSLVWKARCYARLGMGEKAYQMLQALFSPVKSTVFEMGNDGGGIYPNFFMACPPFMIEANFGFIASLLELLVQVHEDEIKLLPALPEALASGEFNRLRLPNQIEMSMNWRDGKIAELSITSKISQTVTLRYNDVQFKIDLRENEEQSIYMSSFAEAEMGVFNLKPRAQKKATIIDVASQAGVAVGTVSRYLNGETLRKSNRERIEFAISELHFKRNLNAVAMRRTQAKFVGFILPHFDEFHVGVLNHLTQALKREGFVILPYIHGSENIHLADARDYFQEHRIDLLITSGDINFASQSEILEDMGVPVILYSNDALGLDVDRVLIQDLKASEAAVNHLIDMGHKNIGILRGNMGDTTAQDRFAGYVQALKNHDLNFDEKTQCAAEGWHETDGYSGTHALLSGSNPPTAIFCSNHLQARGAIRYLSEHNIKIGEDISILSFGDSEYFPYIANGISAVRLPDAEIAKTLSDFTISRLNRENTPFRRTITAQCDLVIRGSVAKLEASK